MTKSQYLRRILKRFGMDRSAKPISTLLASHFKLSASMSPSTDNERKQMENVPYANAVGAWMFTRDCTRPDISHTVSMVNKYMQNLGKGH